MNEMTLEEHLASLNENIFFKEFSFSRNEFSPQQNSELEFADHVIWLDELLITFQLKERAAQLGNHTRATETKWFEKKVVGLGTKQIRETVRYLDSYDNIEITNEKGHVFDVALAKTNDPIHVVSYQPHALLPRKHLLKKFHLSRTVGFIHLIPIYDWAGICHTLITPAEIAEYLSFRKETSAKHEHRVNTLPEQALMGQFLYGDLAAFPDIAFAEYLGVFVQGNDEFDMSHIFRVFADRIVRILELSPSLGVEEEIRYYEILKELAKLNRNELQAVKLRYDLCIEECKTDIVERPYRMASPRTGCGFVFFVVPHAQASTTVNALRNFTYAHKYDQKLEKCVGISFHRDGEYFDVGWCYLAEPWVYDSEMEKRLRENFPFRTVKAETVPRYKFGTQVQGGRMT